ncbi:inositol phosphorylceramide glucuronosyltransferase 1-like isoform X2 [Spinacia oleracea]|nr:inositol phosphorylceramide glucuronosyltransferase 1-like isoform X2 [Spinacia oleracea]
MVDEKELRVIHYTLGPLKPWDWWTALLVKPVDLWQHTKQGPIIRQEFIVGPYETLCCQLKNRCCASFCCRLSFISHELQPAALLWFAIQSTLVSWRNISVCLLTVVISLGLALLIVPLQVLPWTRLLLMYEWTFTIFFLLFGGNQRHATSYNTAVLYYGLGMAFLAIAVPSLPFLCGIIALFVRFSNLQGRGPLPKRSCMKFEKSGLLTSTIVNYPQCK